ncbi:hypothetical protein LguiA_024485 [Lonicera macranthoides]
MFLRCLKWPGSKEYNFEIYVNSSSIAGGDVENIVKELMEEEKGNRMKNKAMEWREMAKEATWRREMDAVTQKPHAVCIPYPAQSHIKAMLKLAKLLHSRGIQITFVNTEYNHNRFLKSGGPDSLAGLPDFRFETIPDGLPPSDSDSTQNVAALFKSLQNNCLGPFLGLLEKIPPVTCIVSDGFMTFTIDAGEKVGIPVVLSWTIAACGFISFFHFRDIREKGFTILKGTSLKDISSIIRKTESDDIIFKYCMESVIRSCKASANVIHTFNELEADIVHNTEWEVGLEIDSDIKRDDVEKVAKELMEGEKGKKMKNKAMEWMKKAGKATGTHGSSSLNLDMLINNFFFSQ